MTILFTSDEHYDHERAIQLCGRPFPSVMEMNSTIRDNHNSMVKDGDVVYHLGDYAFGNNAANHLKSLNGRHILIRGNHDRNSVLRAGFESVSPVLMLKHKGLMFFLSHYAHRVWPQKHYGAFHLYGHSHGTLPGIDRSMDVGVDPLKFFPISLDEVVARLEVVGK